MIARRLSFVALVALLVAPRLSADCVSLPTLGGAYSQDFNTLASTGTSSVLPSGWAFGEAGTNANTTYSAGNGSGTAGDTYSFGSTGSTERAFGGLLSGSLNPTIGACFTNNTGGLIQSLAIVYTGEQWRFGQLNRGSADRLDFQYSVDPSATLTTGTFTDFNTLDFNGPIITGPATVLDGNAPPNRTMLSSTISGLSIPNGATFWIRWTDFNATGSDDGLAVDDFSLTPGGIALPSLSIDDVSVTEGNSGTAIAHFTVSLSSPALLGGVSFDIATQNNTATAGSDYIARSLSGQLIPAGSTTYGFDVTVNGDTTFEPNETFFVNVTHVVGATLGDGQGLGTINNDDVGLVRINAVNTVFGEDFNTLAASGTSTTTPEGWTFAESGSSARNDGKYSAGNGSDTAGDVYSFGATGSSDRAFGSLLSGTLTPTVGGVFLNNTGVVITTLSIAYTGEQWRLGTAGRSDRLNFQYSTNATSLTTGSWTDVDALDFITPNTTVTGALDGNAAANRRFLSFTIAGLSIPPGSTFWIRFSDFDASSADDGLAIDDFAIIANIAGGLLTINDVSVNEGDSGTITAHFVVSLSSPAGPGGVRFDIATADGTATTADNDYVARSLSDQLIPEGSSTYSFDVIVNGDTAIEPTETFSVNVTNVFGAAVNDGLGVGTIVADDFNFTAIHDVQGSGNTSPYNGSEVTVDGIVTGIKQGGSGGFFVQTPDADVDGDPNTSEGIFVFTGASLPGGVVIGNRVAVTGTVQEFPAASAPNTATELTTPSVSVLATGQPLPAAVAITAADGAPSSNINQYERFEGMRVMTTLTVVAPTQGSVNEPNATSTPNGVFYGVVQGVARPMREPGIPQTDPIPSEAACGVCIPRFDNNPELLRVDSDSQPGAIGVDVAAGQTVANVVGPLDFGFNQYTIIQDAATPPTVSGPSTFTAVPVAGPNELTVGSYNLERFFDTADDPDTSEPILTTTAFNNRLNKASLAIRNVLRTPDVLGVVEMENLSTLQSLASKINSDAVTAGSPNPNYQAYLFEGNDIGGIDVGFLVKSTRVTVISVTQEGKATTFVQPDGATALLNDRPPLILVAAANRPDGTPFRFTVIVNHLRSLSGVTTDDSEGRRIRAKRAAQAEFLANLVQNRQVANPSERIILVGDFNAFEFSDGLVDVIGTIKGTPTPANFVAVASSDLVNPDLTDLVDTLPAAERYSFSFDGNAQDIDHAIVNSALMPSIARVAFGRVDADFPEAFRNNVSRPERISDHDGIIAFINVPAAQLTLNAPASATYGGAFDVTVTARDEMNNVETGYRGTVTFSSTLAATLPGAYTFTSADHGSHTFTIVPRAVGSNGITVTSNGGATANAVVHIDPASLTITADDKLAIFGSALPPFTASYDGLVAGDTPALLPTPAFSSPASVGTTVGQYPIHVSGVSSPNYDIKFFDGTLTINAASTTTAVPAVSGQYSDSATISASVSPAFLAGQQLTGTVAFTLNGESIGSVPIDASGAASVTISLNRAPGSYAVAASFTSTNSNFNSSAGNNTLTVSPEDARVTYSGPLLVSTPSVDISATTITLRATIQDISVTADAGGDTEPGDIANANVTIVDRDSGATIASNLPLSFLNADHTSGSITFDWLVNIGSLDAQTFRIGFIVGGYYARNSSDDDALITVSKPAMEFISGGGYLNLTSSGGPLAGNGSKANFGFAFKYNKSGTNLKGHINLVIRSGAHTWQVKSNNPTSLAGPPSTGRVTVLAKATVRELGGAVVEPNATVELSMSDIGEPGDNDTLAITIWSKSGALLFSSNWNGAKTEEQVLGGGDLQVH